MGMGAGEEERGGCKSGQGSHSCAAQAHQIRARRDKRNGRFLISSSQYPRMSTCLPGLPSCESGHPEKGRSLRATMLAAWEDDLNVTLSSTRQPYLTYQRNRCGRAADGPWWEISRFGFLCQNSGRAIAGGGEVYRESPQERPHAVHRPAEKASRTLESHESLSYFRSANGDQQRCSGWTCSKVWPCSRHFETGSGPNGLHYYMMGSVGGVPTGGTYTRMAPVN